MPEHLTYREARDRLSAAQKPGAGVPAYLRWVNRSLGRHAAATAAAIGATPNQVTVLSAVLSVAGMATLAFAGLAPAAAVGAALLLLAGYALDSADGQLARLTGTGSVAGEWLDHVIDAARLPLLHLAVAVYLVRAGEPMAIVVAAVAFALLSSVWFFAQTLAEKLADQVPRAPEPGDAEAPTWVSFAKLPYDVGVVYLVVALSAWPALFVAVYLALLAVTLAVAMVSMWRKFRMLRAVAETRLS